MAEPVLLNEQIHSMQLRMKQLATTITDSENFEAHVELLRALRDLLKSMNEHCDNEIKQAHLLHKSLIGKKQDICQPVLELELVVRARMSDFHRHRRSEEKLQLEKSTVEITKARDRAITTRSDEAKKAGLREESRLIEAERTVPVIAIAKNALKLPKGVSERKTVHFTIVDANQIPRNLLQPNMKAIRKMVESLGNDADIPGVKVWCDIDLTVRQS